MRRSFRPPSAALWLLAAASLSIPPAPPVAPTPPMGWNSWNHFACDVSDSLIRGTADAMVSSGMRDAGYRYVVIDDCWQVARAADGTIVADSARFPDGIKALADYVHSKGLKFGIYTDAGTKTCQGRPGSLGHEEQDARTYAAWGVDYVKEDWCNAAGLDARDAVREISRRAPAHRPADRAQHLRMGFEPAVGLGARRSATCGARRTTSRDFVGVDAGQPRPVGAARHRRAGPGHWNDPDMLEVGNGGMTDDEYRAHFSLWAMQGRAAHRRQRSARHVGRDEGDSHQRRGDRGGSGFAGGAGYAGVDRRPALQVWAKPLANGDRAVALLNRSDTTARITAWFRRTGVRTDSARVRDLWTHADVGTFRGQYADTVPAHGVRMLRVRPVSSR